MVKIKNKPDTLKNFSVDFEKLKKEYLSYTKKLFETAATIFRYTNIGEIEAYDTGSLRDGLISYAIFHDMEKDKDKAKPDFQLCFSDGKITLSVRVSLGSISFSEKLSWNSFDDFKKGFVDFLLSDWKSAKK